MEGDRNPLVSSMAYSEGDLKVLIVVLKEEKNKQQKQPSSSSGLEKYVGAVAEVTGSERRRRERNGGRSRSRGEQGEQEEGFCMVATQQM